MAYDTSIYLNHQGQFHVYPIYHDEHNPRSIPTSIEYWTHKRKWRYPSIKHLVKAVEKCNAWCGATNAQYEAGKKALAVLDKSR